MNALHLTYSSLSQSAWHHVPRNPLLRVRPTRVRGYVTGYISSPSPAWRRAVGRFSDRFVTRIGRYPVELDEDEEEQIYIVEPPEDLQGGTCHKTFFLELLSSVPEFEATIPDSGQDPPWCGDGDRFFVDNQVAIASALDRAHKSWNKLCGMPRRSWKGSLVGIAFAIHEMKDDELFAGLVSKADFSLLFEALFHGLTVGKMVRMTTGSPYDWPDFYTMDLYPRDFRLRYFGPAM